MKIEVTFIADQSFNVHVFRGNIQRIKIERLSHDVKVGGHSSIVWFSNGSTRWYRLLRCLGSLKNLEAGFPIVTDQFDFGDDDTKRLQGN